LLHKQSVKQRAAAASSTGTCPTVNQQAYWNHVSKYLRDQGGRGGIKAAADSWADTRSESAAEQKAKGKAAAKATAKAKAKAKAESKSAKATAKAKAKAAKQQEAKAAKQQEAKAKQTKIGVTKTIQDNEKAKKGQQKKCTAKEQADKAKADKVWAAFRASGAKKRAAACVGSYALPLIGGGHM
jgi:membrane protein involved in colicin uptake